MLLTIIIPKTLKVQIFSKGGVSMSNIRNQIIAGINVGNFLEVVYQVYRDNQDDKVSIGLKIATLHNEGELDAVAEFRKLTHSEQKYHFLEIRQVFEDALPHIDAPVSKVMDCVKHLVIEVSNDMASGMIIPPFIEFCQANAERPEEVLSVALTDIDDSFDFITPAIVSGSNLQLSQYVNKAIDLCKHDDIKIRIRATHALSRINYKDNKELIAQALHAIESTIDEGYDEALFAAALRSVFSLYIADNSNEESIVQLAKHILNFTDDLVLHAASEILFFEKGKIPVSIIELLLKSLTRTKPQNKGTLNYIDYGLCSLFEQDMSDRVILFLEEILVQNAQAISIKQFDRLSSKILQNKECSLDKLITRWLLSKDVKKLGFCAIELLRYNPVQDIAIKADLSQLDDLPEGIHYFLARKACGWFFLNPVSATSFIVSLIDSAPENEVQPIGDVLFNPLLISYSKSVKHYLEEISEESSDKVKQVITQLFSQLDNYHEGLKSTGDIAELLPTQEQREAYYRYQSRLTNEYYKEAQKNSIVNLIATKSVLLYGNRSIHYIYHGSNNQKTRQEVPLQPISHSVEFPSLEYLEPHGLDYKLRVFRFERNEP
ncbi:conserved hypothetical protein [Beggiatoa sp. PS]|nr:conserved hypothetical protein [Beggiatoa sp. PS]